MKPELEQVQKKASKSFTVRLIKRPNRPMLSKAWHYHPEIEICFTPKSIGRRYVGNNISDYRENDLVILGPNLPHGFTTTQRCEQHVIQFRKDFLGNDFFGTAELEKINKFLERSKRGLCYTGTEIHKIKKKIVKLSKHTKTSFKQLIDLLRLLEILAESDDFKPICTEKYSTLLSAQKLYSIKSIFDYIENNFQRELSIEDACKVVNLTPSAFYKFIKRHTDKKFTTILNEYRTDHAYKLLASSSLPISEVSYQSGYRNLSHFNRTFKSTYGMSPRQLRSHYKQSSDGRDI